MRTAFETMLGLLFGIVESEYSDGANLNAIFTQIQKLQNDIIILYNSDELNHREYQTLYTTASIIRDQLRIKLGR